MIFKKKRLKGVLLNGTLRLDFGKKDKYVYVQLLTDQMFLLKDINCSKCKLKLTSYNIHMKTIEFFKGTNRLFRLKIDFSDYLKIQNLMEA